MAWTPGQRPDRAGKRAHQIRGDHVSLPSDLTGMLADAGLVPEYVEDLVRAAVEEDLARGVDITSEATVPRDQRSVGELVARADGVVAGLAVAEAAFVSTSDQPLEVERTVADGNAVTAGSVLMTLTGRTRALLLAERTALNLLCHLSDVAVRRRTDQGQPCRRGGWRHGCLPGRGRGFPRRAGRGRGGQRRRRRRGGGRWCEAHPAGQLHDGGRRTSRAG